MAKFKIEGVKAISALGKEAVADKDGLLELSQEQADHLSASYKLEPVKSKEVKDEK